MANPLQLPTERGPSPAQMGPQGGQAPRPAVTLPPDASGPPINPNLTSLSPNRMMAVKQSQMGGATPGSDSMGGPQSLEDAIAQSTKLFAQIMMANAEFLPIILEIGKTMAGESDEGGPGKMDNAAVVDEEESEPRPAPARQTTMRPQGASPAQQPPGGGGPPTPRTGPGAGPTGTPPMRPGGGGGAGPMPSGRPDPRRALQAQMAAR